ncbi:hypothetical protein A2U01_0007153, partial [Trifolium medium]|nr:hypothetical protein [Trifolium medium]
MLVDKAGLWYRVLVARYVEVAGRLAVGGRSGSSWREVAKIRDGESAEGGVPLSVKYRRLFDLSINKSSTVVIVRNLGWEEGGAAWLWRRQLWAWEEEMLGQCRSLLSDIVLQSNVADQWLWRHDLGGGYTVRGSYHLLTFRELQDGETITDLIWHKQEHFVQFIHSSGGLRARRSFLQLIWLCSIWVVWNEWNNRIFKAKESTVHQMLDK